MSAEVVVARRDGPLLTLRINRPEEENRLDLAVLEGLVASLEDAERTDDVRAVVVTGTGATFCAGGDIDEFASGDRRSYEIFAERFAALHLSIARLSKPVLAAVNGDVRAGGLSLLSICDLAVAPSSARFSMPEIRAGLWPVMAMVALGRTLPRKRALELYYFAESFGAEEAKALGLVNWVVSPEEVDREVRQRALDLARLPRAAVRIGRETFAAVEERSLEDGYRYSAKRLVELLTDPEVVDALAARKEEKDKP